MKQRAGEGDGALDPVKETCRLIRLARSKWEAHNNAACRTERERALSLYASLSPEARDRIPQELRVWLRYRSEKYFGPGRTAPSRAAGKSGGSTRRGPTSS
ncbi:MAG TPA: Precorrin-3B methylase [Spirochaetia bacterium]|nr:Precorrin-3B methylase [Spirochaetia bacterium]